MMNLSVCVVSPSQKRARTQIVLVISGRRRSFPVFVSTETNSSRFIRTLKTKLFQKKIRLSQPPRPPMTAGAMGPGGVGGSPDTFSPNMKPQQDGFSISKTRPHSVSGIQDTFDMLWYRI